MSKNFIALITAREGSQGIKNKNLKKINGHPLIAYSIFAAKKSKNIKKVYVTTDGNNIAKISKKYGADVIMRPKNLAGGRVMPDHALVHAVDYLEKKKEISFENIVFLQPTSILRKKNDIDNAIKTFKKEKADSLFTSSDMHIFLWQKKNKNLAPINYNYKKRKRRQEQPLEYIENGSFYITNKKILKKNNNRLGGKVSSYIMDNLSLFEIDTYEDFKTVSLIFSSGIAKKAKIVIPEKI
ncbi:MAG: acylneuraminate cytidylyltransferase family protein [Candidatus Pelagibacter sp. TMED165]|nr:MAG: acylneuraminate cytidylyltransferase family protein [Candidatus Pelagibacter sp. TMED165]